MLLLALAWLAGALVALLAWHAAAPLRRWRLRGIPGPRPVPLLGNLPQLARRGRMAALHAWAAEFGPVYKARAPESGITPRITNTIASPLTPGTRSDLAGLHAGGCGC